MVTGAAESHPHQQEQPLPAGSYVRTNRSNTSLLWRIQFYTRNTSVKHKNSTGCFHFHPPPSLFSLLTILLLSPADLGAALRRTTSSRSASASWKFWTCRMRSFTPSGLKGLKRSVKHTCRSRCSHSTLTRACSRSTSVLL